MLINKKVVLSASIALVSSVTFTGIAQASTLFTADLSGANEVPPTGSAATGLASVLLNDAEDQITVNASFSGLASPVTGAHIHQAPVGSNGPIKFDFQGVAGATSSIPEQIFAINAAQVTILKNSGFYVNIHNADFPTGEIRGQLQSVPEPLTILGTMTALGLGASLKRRLVKSK